MPGDKPAVEPGARSALAAGDKPAVEPGAKSTLQQGGSGVIPGAETAGKTPIEPAPTPSGVGLAAAGAAVSAAAPHPSSPADSKAIESSTPAPVAAPVAAENAQADDKIGATGGLNEPKPVPKPARRADLDGWMSIPNSGSMPVDPTEKVVGQPGDAGVDSGSRLDSSAADSRFHAGRSMEFEPEPSQSPRIGSRTSESTGRARNAEAAAVEAPQPRAASHSERVEANEHLVERGENYWTISRQYWGSGRYFVALWKANSANHPDINVLHTGDVIVVPSIEDLNPDYIVPPGKTASTEWLASLGITLKGSRPSKARERSDSTESDGAGTGTQASRSARVPARRASLSDEELDLPAPDTSSRRDRTTSYKGRSTAAAKVFDGDNAGDEPEVRTAARPRAAAAVQASRPVYRVRTYDTLRSIARDTLGDARRANEILDLNRGLIDDPNQLVAGQVLELPDDARTAIRRRSGR